MIWIRIENTLINVNNVVKIFVSGKSLIFYEKIENGVLNDAVYKSYSTEERVKEVFESLVDWINSDYYYGEGFIFEMPKE